MAIDPMLYRLQIPPAVTGYELNPEKGFWSLVAPVRAINLITNPSAEFTTLDFSSDRTLARILTDSVFGQACFQCSPGGAVTSYIRYFPSPVVYPATGVPIATWSLWSKATAGETLQMDSGVGTTLTWKASGSWERKELTFGFTPTSTYDLRLRKTTATANLFWSDGWQLEQSGFSTSFFDGDSPGCFWYGVPHHSYSERPALAVGGRTLNFKDLGFRVTNYSGAELPLVSNFAIPNALTGGSQYQRTSIPQRVISISGVVVNTTFSALEEKVVSLSTYLAPDAGEQIAAPLMLRFDLYNDSGTDSFSQPVVVPVIYAGGMEGQVDNLNQVRAVLQFVEYRPPSFQELKYEHTNVTIRSSLTNLSNLGQLLVWNLDKQNYAWNRITDSGGLAAPVAATAIVRTNLLFNQSITDGFIAAGSEAAGPGSFVIGSFGTTPDFTTFVSLNGACNTLVFDVSGNLLAGGAFTTPQTRIMKIDKSTLLSSAYGAANNTVNALAFDNLGKLYATGDFTSIGGSAINRVAYTLDGATWTTLVGTGISATGRALVKGRDGKIYIGGDFVTANGVTVNQVVVYDPVAGTFTPLTVGANTGTNGLVRSLAALPDGSIVLAGDFTTAGGVTVNYICLWNGSRFIPLGQGLNNTVNAVTVDAQGSIIAGGTFTGISGSSRLFPNKLAKWDGAEWLPIDLDIPSNPAINAVAAFDQLPTLLIGTGTTTGTIFTGGNVTVSYAGTAGTAPKIYFNGPGVLYQLSNLTTGRDIYFDYKLLAGETAILDLEKLTRSSLAGLPADDSLFTSNFYGNIIGKILPTSDLGSFFLRAGKNGEPCPNVLKCFMTGDASHVIGATSLINVLYKNTHWGSAGGLR
jgi:hypothetical protein